MPIHAQKSYSQFKNEKIEKNKKTALAGLELITFYVTDSYAIHYTTSYSAEIGGSDRI